MTTASDEATTGSPISIFARAMASPFSVSTTSASPLSRLIADGFATVLPARTTFTYLSQPGRRSV